jgi:mRNA interferase MazF
MTSGTRFEQGDILIVPFPFSDLSAIKQRPVLVMSKEDLRDDIIACGITSNLRDSANSIPLAANNLTRGTLPATSRVKIDKIFTLEKSIVRKRIARINTVTMQRAREMFRDLV